MKITRAMFLAIAAIAFAGCSGGGKQQASASATPRSAQIIATPTPPNPAAALDVSLVSATIIGTPTPQNMVPVRVLYRIRVDAPNGIASAYGSAALPFSPNCDGGAAAAIQEGPLAHGAVVQRHAKFYCDQDSAKSLTGDSPGFFTMIFSPSLVTFPAP